MVEVCPKCRRPLRDAGDERGWCPVHGSVFVDFGKPREEDEDDD